MCECNLQSTVFTSFCSDSYSPRSCCSAPLFPCTCSHIFFLLFVLILPLLLYFSYFIYSFSSSSNSHSSFHSFFSFCPSYFSFLPRFLLTRPPPQFFVLLMGLLLLLLLLLLLPLLGTRPQAFLRGSVIVEIEGVEKLPINPSGRRTRFTSSLWAF